MFARLHYGPLLAGPAVWRACQEAPGRVRARGHQRQPPRLAVEAGGQSDRAGRGRAAALEHDHPTLQYVSLCIIVATASLLLYARYL